jgi:hypothetical protein
MGRGRGWGVWVALYVKCMSHKILYELNMKIALCHNLLLMTKHFSVFIAISSNHHPTFDFATVKEIHALDIESNPHTPTPTPPHGT